MMRVMPAGANILSARQSPACAICFQPHRWRNPWVHGDGVGYSPMLDRCSLREASISRRTGSTEPELRDGASGPGWPRASQRIHLKRPDRQRMSIGPSLFGWPFLVVTHQRVLLVEKMGAHIAADGFSRPYLITMAVATAFYGFAGLCIFRFALARKIFWRALGILATLGIWWASSLPVYMYYQSFLVPCTTRFLPWRYF